MNLEEISALCQDVVVTPPGIPISTAAMLHLAARAGARGFGAVEPNPMVGCVLASPDGEILAIGHHRRFGHIHAEVDALQRCEALGRSARGATAYVTLEPCAHHGNQPPCAEALAEAGVARVVMARRDPHDLAAGGADMLRKAGVEVVEDRSCREAVLLAAPFVKRVRTGLPWVVAKWAQTLDGRIATRTGQSKWITGPGARRRVHLLRGRVDAILTGLGTVADDDPLLTARGVPTRRTALRVVIDPEAELSPDSQLVRTADEVPVAIVHADELTAAASDRADHLRSLGVRTIPAPVRDGSLDFNCALRTLVSGHSVSNVLVEAGKGVLSEMFRGGLVDEARVFVAPTLLGDAEAMTPLAGWSPQTIADGLRMTPLSASRIGPDIELRYLLGNVESAGASEGSS